MSEMEQQGQYPQSQEASNEAAWDEYVSGMLGDQGENAPREEFQPAVPVAPEQFQVAPELDGPRLEREVDELVREHPELADPEIAEAVVAAAQQRAYELGAPELWRDPRLIRMVFVGEGGAKAFRPKLGLADEMIQAHGQSSIFGTGSGFHS